MSDASSLNKELKVFLVFLVVFSGICYAIILDQPEIGNWAIAIMWCPGLAAMLSFAICRKTLRGLGWGWGKTSWQLHAYFLPIAYAAVTYALLWATGLAPLKSDLGSLPVIQKAHLMVLIGTISGIVTGLGEEIGWRGLFFPHLQRRFGFDRACIITALVWAAWHMPLILFSNYHNDAPTWYSVICFSVMVLGLCYLFGYLRLVSGSLWTAAILHGSHNLYVQMFFDQMTEKTKTSVFFSGEFGAGLAIMVGLVAILYRKKALAFVERTGAA